MPKQNIKDLEEIPKDLTKKIEIVPVEHIDEVWDMVKKRKRTGKRKWTTKKVKVLVLTGYGTNCDRESGYAAQIAGADEVIISHFSEIVQERVKIEDYNFLIFPGGFLDGDHLGAAQAAAIRIRYSKTKSGLSILNQIKKSPRGWWYHPWNM